MLTSLIWQLSPNLALPNTLLLVLNGGLSPYYIKLTIYFLINRPLQLFGKYLLPSVTVLYFLSIFKPHPLFTFIPDFPTPTYILNLFRTFFIIFIKIIPDFLHEFLTLFINPSIAIVSKTNISSHYPHFKIPPLYFCIKSSHSV